ncbi:MAG: hypothetical protein DHS20C12_02860 [Pseudohongiella sp.]|nr:MAG: hypothetical protein DHS20C12_02860 [Pseudohongiella sp.]
MMNGYSHFRVQGFCRAILVAGLVLVGLASCSNKAMYQTLQQNGLRACQEIPIAQQPSCKAQYQKDYETYKRERDALEQG